MAESAVRAGKTKFLVAGKQPGTRRGETRLRSAACRRDPFTVADSAGQSRGPKTLRPPYSVQTLEGQPPDESGIDSDAQHGAIHACKYCPQKDRRPCSCQAAQGSEGQEAEPPRCRREGCSSREEPGCRERAPQGAFESARFAVVDGSAGASLACRRLVGNHCRLRGGQIFR